MVLAGFAAKSGYLAFWAVVLCGFIGSVCGDQLFFFIGRFGSARFLKHRPGLHEKVAKATRILDRFDTLFILSFRFLYGLRTVSPFAIGMSNVSIKKFALLNFISAAIWAVSVAALGYSFGKAVEKVLAHVKHVQFLIIGLIICAALAVIISRRIRAHLAKKHQS